jgi:hypothetical protein
MSTENEIISVLKSIRIILWVIECAVACTATSLLVLVTRG